jgi:hypothetical protein
MTHNRILKIWSPLQKPLMLALPLWLAGLAVLALSAGCVSLIETAGRALDGSAFGEKTSARYLAEKTGVTMDIREVQNKAGERSLVIGMGEFPALHIRASFPPDQGASEAGLVQISALCYLGGSASGWNEFTLDLFGQGTFTADAGGASLSIPEKPEAVEISSGKIKRYDTLITGSEALTGLRNRRERILALTAWMRERGGGPAGFGRSAFERYWKPVLLPERVSKKKRPAEYRDGDPVVRAEDINWNRAYTERVFPEALRPVRDSGTLLRDWEEAFEWIYFEYQWDAITALFQDGIGMQKKK